MTVRMMSTFALALPAIRAVYHQAIDTFRYPEHAQCLILASEREDHRECARQSSHRRQSAFIHSVRSALLQPVDEYAC
jgi:hypothetical protein